MPAPSGEQLEIEAAGYRAVVTECGAGLRTLSYDDRALLDGYGPDEMASRGRGQLLVPWPNRIRDGAYSFRGRDLQLPLTEPARHNASHGLVRWASWRILEHSAGVASLGYRLMAQTGYPWSLALQVRYQLGEDGLRVTQSATNLAPEPAPYASGAHPYLRIGEGVDHLELTLPARTRAVVDERKIPVRLEDVSGTAYDFREPRRLGDTVLDDGFGDLARGADGCATAVLRDPESGRAVELWVDEHHRWLQVYTADDAPIAPRRSLAVEPMTAPANAFGSGTDLLTLAPAGEDGDSVSVAWGIRAVG